MQIIDAQLHEPAVTFEWRDVDGPTRWDVLLELQIGYLRAVGVDQAILFPVDAAWGRYAAKKCPERFTFVPMITHRGAFGGLDVTSPDIEERVAAEAELSGLAGIRLLRTTPTPEGGHDLAPIDAFDRAIGACEALAIPMFMSTAGDLVTPGQIARRHPDLTVIIDHLGLSQPPSYQRESPPMKYLPDLLELAAIPNVAVKLSAAPTLASTGYPFPDLWPPLRQIVDAFGADRLMWGSDISRVMGRAGFDHPFPRGEGDYLGKHTYAEALLYIRESDVLSVEERTAILGGTAQRLLRWPTPAGP